MTPEEFEDFRHKAVHALMDLNDQLARAYRISTWPRWDYDLQGGTLFFSEDNAPQVVTSIQVVGTTSNAKKNWLWSWANGYLPQLVVSRMRAVRRFGQKEGLRELTEPYWNDDLYHGWEMTAIAAHILRAKGAYRCPNERGFMYVVFTDISAARR